MNLCEGMNSGAKKRNLHLVERIKLLTETTELCLRSIEVRNKKIQSLKVASDYWEKVFMRSYLLSRMKRTHKIFILKQDLIKELRIELKTVYDKNVALERKVKTIMVSAESNQNTRRGTCSSVILSDKDCSADYSCSDDSFSRTGISAMIRKPVALGPIHGLYSRKFTEREKNLTFTNKPPRSNRPSECKSKRIELVISSLDRSNLTLCQGDSVRRSRLDSPRPTPRMGCATPRRIRRSLSVPHQSPVSNIFVDRNSRFFYILLFAIITDDDSINVRNINNDLEDRSLLVTSKDESESFGLNHQETVCFVFSRAHNCKETRVYLRDVCDVCGKRLGMGQMAMRCSVCRQMCHEMCHHRLNNPCAPRRIDMPKISVGQRYSLPDWCCENIRPMVPYALIVSVTYLDRHHLSAENIYKSDCSEGLVQDLVLQFRSQRMHPVLSRFDPHCIAGYIKAFIKDLAIYIRYTKRKIDYAICQRQVAMEVTQKGGTSRRVYLRSTKQFPFYFCDTIIHPLLTLSPSCYIFTVSIIFSKYIDLWFYTTITVGYFTILK
uniref:Phorbol-ester/DAG-type domain-containing protein n=1 Tax=Heterorhabditis bacteriophora TaxID=37862 RepID=A0A1I7WPV2_HETBA